MYYNHRKTVADTVNVIGRRAAAGGPVAGSDVLILITAIENLRKDVIAENERTAKRGEAHRTASARADEFIELSERRQDIINELRREKEQLAAETEGTQRGLPQAPGPRRRPAHVLDVISTLTPDKGKYLAAGIGKAPLDALEQADDVADVGTLDGTDADGMLGWSGCNCAVLRVVLRSLDNVDFGPSSFALAR